jgi:hypothetical protein
LPDYPVFTSCLAQRQPQQRDITGKQLRKAATVAAPGTGTFRLTVRALLSDMPKKNSWVLAEHVGLATPETV